MPWAKASRLWRKSRGCQGHGITTDSSQRELQRSRCQGASVSCLSPGTPLADAPHLPIAKARAESGGEELAALERCGGKRPSLQTGAEPQQGQCR